MQFTGLNCVLRKIVVPLNYINMGVGLLIGIAHVYLPFTSLFGLLLGLLTALSGSIGIGINYWFNFKHTQQAPAQESPRLKDTRRSNLFLGIAIPVLLLNTASCFFGMYTGTLLLVAALNFTISPPVTIALAIALATILATGTLINSWMQIHSMWEELKIPFKTNRSIPALQQERRPAPPLGLKVMKKNEQPLPAFAYWERRRKQPYTGIPQIPRPQNRAPMKPRPR